MATPLHIRISALVPTITGWCSVEKANDLALAIIKLRSSVTVEIGVWGGRSLIPMALAHQEQDHGVVWAIDPWSSQASIEGYDKVNADWWGAQNHEVVYKGFLDALRIHGVERFVNVIRKRSDDVAPPDVIDLLHLDGQHTDQAVRDIERFAARVRPGGFVFVDDIGWTGGGVGRAVSLLLTMGFVKLFDRDTGAMFERAAPKPAAKKSAPKPVAKKAEPAPKKRGRPAKKKTAELMAV